MKRLTPPVVQDEVLLTNLSKTGRKAGIEELRARLAEILVQYGASRDRMCRGVELLAPPLSARLAKLLSSYFDDPTAAFKYYIKFIRAQLSPDVCPMCGSVKTGTVDHFVGRVEYPELALFSLNLVPACGCNSVRRTTRDLFHPYFDVELERRLVVAAFTRRFSSPTARLIPAPGLEPELSARVQIHINAVIVPNNVEMFMIKKWATLIRGAARVLTLDRGSTPEQVRGGLLRRLNEQDAEHGTPNNWFSAFFAGVAASDSACGGLSMTLSNVDPETVDDLV
jgi:hypothetical protein